MAIGWILLSALIVACALGVVISRSPISSALSLLVGFIGVAVLYLALKAEFVAAVQVLVYAGGILVLYIFGIMLTDNEALRLTRQVQYQAWPVFILVLVLFLAMGHKLYHSDYTVQPPRARGLGFGGQPGRRGQSGPRRTGRRQERHQHTTTRLGHVRRLLVPLRSGLRAPAGSRPRSCFPRQEGGVR